MSLLYLYRGSGMAHLDVKPDNFVVREDDLTLHLIDFGSSGMLDKMLARWVTTINYAPPEVLAGCVLDQQNRIIGWSGPEFDPLPVDVWSLGATFFLILFQSVPFHLCVEKPDPLKDPLYQMLYTNGSDIASNQFFHAHNAYGKRIDALQLIWDCLNPAADERPSLAQIL